jgi:uncharacterized pyridoxal phosphate-containing UPF0001 family protein
VRNAVAAGISLFGENRVQEALAKMPEVPGARWHLVGPLQSNKARRAVEAFETIQTVASVELARRLDRIAGSWVARPCRFCSRSTSTPTLRSPGSSPATWKPSLPTLRPRWA